MFALLSCFAASAPYGGWTEVDKNSEEYYAIKKQVSKDYVNFLNEYKQRNTLLQLNRIQKQIVNGVNYIVTFTLGFDKFQVKLHKDLDSDKLKYTGFKQFTKPKMMGGWVDDTNTCEEKMLNSVLSNRKNSFEVDQVIFVRRQITKGIDLFVVYTDKNGDCHYVSANVFGEVVTHKEEGSF